MPHLQNLSLGLKKSCLLSCKQKYQNAAWHVWRLWRDFMVSIRIYAHCVQNTVRDLCKIPQNPLNVLVGILGNFAKVSFYNCKYF
ncbi:hypothetical protein NM70030_0552 [Neisseria meningitidis 70030]|nr:hypothetical protein NMEN69166_1870 [Neisseria meningitidis 69166]ELK66520.1 hypothetical protein NM68094_0464 [Neisseria meningitidis 68094]ELK69442.1 hypothetical protein NM70012_1760 [Neisseria meningitidis 70012]ELL14342.1 hypothetical protein NM69096_1732 [Neisseria meningitidis 69096]ELL30304.1 hypothetical protein NM70030_0552 [Neisseria meningitidis 70030]EOB39864.1 hypothetical protein NM70021_1784 [Neisseria meningitidis 70021]EOB39975.1 hypothetical protein NM69155_1809 [Neisser